MRRFSLNGLMAALAVPTVCWAAPQGASSSAPNKAQEQAAPPAVAVPGANARPSFAPPVASRVNEKPVSFSELPEPRQFVTRHAVTIGGKRVKYTATAGETYITNISGEPTARFFSFAYVADAPKASRPVLFVFNGGPGSSSIWLQMGVIGPKRVVLDNEVNPSNSPPFGYQDNSLSVLDVADLVFIDPVGTGYSRPVGSARQQDFTNVDADADSVARFIELWLTKNGRWNAPKYLMGESYGTIRAAVLPRALMGGPTYTGVMRGITVDGVIIAGTALNSPREQPAPPDAAAPNRGLGDALPSMAVTAAYHGGIDRAGRTTAQIYEGARAFAAGDYADAVFDFDHGALPAERQADLAAKLESWTGIPAKDWIANRFRAPSTGEFLKRVVASQRLAAGNYDSRYTLPLDGGMGEPVADDPAMARYVPGFVAAFHDMLVKDLGVDMPVPYNAINFEQNSFVWTYDRVGPPPGENFAADLAVAMRRTPKLRVLVASGYYDMVTTPLAAQKQLARGRVPIDRITTRNYESGHMLYLGDTAKAFADDVRAFITSRP
ncbi:S10 family serine carboxypeptidase-like protein [Novosphingobium sp.]|uniref:S10 family peptidase n=1 Tax=Novosphingobium sp. TaxID=1874826 RepID=UPI0028A5ECF6|nr:peptidase S10 [Novosphingobium sp.]